MSDHVRESSAGLPALGLFLAAGLIVSAWIGGDALRDVRSSGQSIVVKGYAERAVTSDFATWSGSFTARAASLSDAYQRIEHDRTQVQAFLAARGLPQGAVVLQPVMTETLYRVSEAGHNTNVVEGYVLRQQVRVESADVKLVETVARAATELIKDGVAFESWQPEYFVAHLDAYKLELLGEATGNARERAAMLAGKSGSKVGKLQSASQGVFQITPANSTMVDDYGTYDTSTIEKVVKAVVTVSYGID
jgi:uncharacterized protein